MTRLEKARQIAEEIKSTLLPFCEKIEIAGSIRREKQEVKDIEIVSLPSNRNQFAMCLINNYGVGCKKDARYIKFSYKGIKVDLFIPQKHDWGRILAIRTGSADYSQKILATGWVKKGFKGTDKGLCMVSGSEVSDPMEFETEEGFFNFLGIKWVEPKYRTL